MKKKYINSPPPRPNTHTYKLFLFYFGDGVDFSRSQYYNSLQRSLNVYFITLYFPLDQPVQFYKPIFVDNLFTIDNPTCYVFSFLSFSLPHSSQFCCSKRSFCTNPLPFHRLRSNQPQPFLRNPSLLQLFSQFLSVSLHLSQTSTKSLDSTSSSFRAFNYFFLTFPEAQVFVKSVKHWLSLRLTSDFVISLLQWP